MKIKYFLSVILITIVYFIIYSYRELNSIPGFGFDKNGFDILEKLIRPIVLSVSTIIGILSKITYDLIRETKEKEFSITKVFKNAISSKQAWLAIILCPIIILSFYTSIEQIRNNALVAIMAYQNGFFFKSILKKNEIE